MSAELRPDTRTTVTARATDRTHKPFTWGAYWLSALIFCLVVRWHVRAQADQEHHSSRHPPAGPARPSAHCPTSWYWGAPRR